jgi:hypothetical protein
MSPRFVAWFSCGAASAVAAKLIVEKYGDAARVVYCDTSASEHPDNLRFLADVERWIGRPIERIRSDKYETVDDVIERRRYLSGIAGAPCTIELKKRPREAYQLEADTHVFGYTAEEADRAAHFEEANPALVVEWILIDRGIQKVDCLSIVAAAGIALPAMYALGFEHNNCPGCVKSQSPGYWNRVRLHFPDVFARRCQQSRTLGVRLIRIRGVRRFLDELPPEEDAPDDAIDCGPVCQTAFAFMDGANEGAA